MNTEDYKDVKDTKDRVNDKILVGVYGTLKKGEGNHRLLSESYGTEFIGRATTYQNYALADLKYYPGMIAGNQIVVLEVYAVTSSTLASLDRLEGHPSLFIREEIEVRMLDFTTKKVIVYMFNRFNHQSLISPDHKIISWNSK